MRRRRNRILLIVKHRRDRIEERKVFVGDFEGGAAGGARLIHRKGIVSQSSAVVERGGVEPHRMILGSHGPPGHAPYYGISRIKSEVDIRNLRKYTGFDSRFTLTNWGIRTPGPAFAGFSFCVNS